ncbi:MAG: hypothetical protein ACOY4R_29615 [Pseudomonadota bacterium]
MRTFRLAILSAAGLSAALPGVAQQPKPVPSAPAKPAVPESPLPTLAISVPKRDHEAVLAYYRAEAAAGRCPAPLVRNGKACGAPPATRPAWRPGQPLPDNVKVEAPPAALIAKLSPSRAGYQYMRVGNDLVIMGIGTRVVAAHVADLSKM